MAGALNGVAEGRSSVHSAFTVACLKRALDHLTNPKRVSEAVAPRKLLPESIVNEARQELFEIREGILKLMDEFRGRK